MGEDLSSLDVAALSLQSALLPTLGSNHAGNDWSRGSARAFPFVLAESPACEIVLPRLTSDLDTQRPDERDCRKSTLRPAATNLRAICHPKSEKNEDENSNGGAYKSELTVIAPA